MEEERKLKCPFLNSWCMGQSCALSTPLYQRGSNGQTVVSHVCAFHAGLTLLSEMNQKQTTGQKVQGPGIYLPGKG